MITKVDVTRPAWLRRTDEHVKDMTAALVLLHTYDKQTKESTYAIANLVWGIPHPIVEGTLEYMEMYMQQAIRGYRILRREVWDVAQCQRIGEQCKPLSKDPLILLREVREERLKEYKRNKRSGYTNYFMRYDIRVFTPFHVSAAREEYDYQDSFDLQNNY